MDAKVCKGPLCNGITKPKTEFSPKGQMCRPCNNHATKEQYKKNDRPYRKQKNELKAKAKCVQCGCDNILLIDFDHTGFKTNHVSKMFSKEEIKNELVLTQFLCIWCHRLKTRKDLDRQMAEKDKEYEIKERPTASQGGKKCLGMLCQGQLQYQSLFQKRRENCLTSSCKICISQKTRTERLKNYEFLKQQKISAKECQICKIEVTEDTTCCFDYDHVEPDNKEVTLSNLARLNTDKTEEMIKEIKKCRLLCCRCHRIHTASQLNWKMAETISVT